MGEITINAPRCSNVLRKRDEDSDSNSPMDRGNVKRIYLNSRTRPYYLRRCKRVRPSDIQSLPDELLSNILARLPADHIHDVARLVCLHWYHIVHSSHFVNAQVQRSTYGLIISCSQVGVPPEQPLFITATQGGQIETCKLRYRCRMGVIDSCNGLVLGYDFTADSLYILNLATKQELLLPSYYRCDPLYEYSALSYAAASMEYKVTMATSAKGEGGHVIWMPSLAILTVGVDDSWRDISVKHLSDMDMLLMSRRPLSTEGSIHWVIEQMRQVLTLDVETETFTTSVIPLREDCKRRSYFLSTGKFLSLLYQRRELLWEVWVMKSRDGEWTKVLPNIDLGAHKLRLQQQFGCGKDLRSLFLPIGWVKYPEVLALVLVVKPLICIFFNRETGGIDLLELHESIGCLKSHPHKNNMAFYT